MGTSFWQIALSFFLVTNPIGNSPTFLALVKDFDFNKQKRILFREGIISLLIALFFQYFGEVFLDLLNVQDYAMTYCGGALLMIISLGMIFPLKNNSHVDSLKQEPFIVPIATPLLSGPGVLTLIMLSSRQLNNHLLASAAIILAWAGVITVLVLAPYLQKLLGNRGMLVLEQLMGMLLAMISLQMFVYGTELFLKALSGGAT